MGSFKSPLKGTDSLIGMLNQSKSLKLEDGVLFRQYILQKGVPIIDLVEGKLNQMEWPYDK